MSVYDVTIPKQYVKVQASQPTTALEGDLLFRTTDDTLLSYTGSAWQEVTPEVSYLISNQIRQSLAILKLEASVSATTQDYTYMFLDKFSDSSGYDNTVDTGNTTAVFDTNKYANAYSNETINLGTLGQFNEAGITTYGGYKITTKEACILVSVTKSTACTATKAYIRTSRGGSNIATATFSGNTATFSSGNTLADNTDYWIFAGADGSGYNRDMSNTITMPITSNTSMDIISGYWSDSDTPENKLRNITGITVSFGNADKIVQTNSITLDAEPNNYQVYSNNAIAGSGSVTYDISFDGGSNWETGKSLDTKYSYSGSGTDTSMILKLNLNGTGSGNTAQADDYAVMVW